MKRCKSTHNRQKKVTPERQCHQKSKSSRKAFKIHHNIVQNDEVCEAGYKDRQKSDKNIERRLNNIRKGFQALECNLNFDYLQNTTNKQLFAKTHTPKLTARKDTRKTFANEGKKTTKKKKCYTSNNQISGRNKKSNELNLAQKYHSCLYEESLISLMKVVIMQREEIKRLKKFQSNKNL